MFPEGACLPKIYNTDKNHFDGRVKNAPPPIQKPSLSQKPAAVSVCTSRSESGQAPTHR